MTKKFAALLWLLSPLLFVISCSKKDKTGLLIPNDAAMVMHINFSSLSSKLSWDEIKQTQFFQKALKENTDDTITSQFLNNPDASGMDFKSGMAFFLRKQGNGMYGVFEGKLKDAAAFRSFTAKVAKNSVPAKDEELTLAELNNHSIVACNDKMFAFLFNTPARSMEEEESASFSIDSLKYFARKTLSLSGSDLLGTDERFASLVNDAGDIHFWINTKQYVDAITGSNPFMSFFNVGGLVSNSASAITLNFENGKISLDIKQYPGEQMKEIYKKNKPENVDAALINRIPSQNPVAVFAMNYKPESIKEILKATNLDGWVNGFLGKVNLNLDEFIQANKGTMIFAITDVETKTVSDTFGVQNGKPNIISFQRPDVKIIFANAVRNKAAFDKLIDFIDREKEALAEKMPGITYKMQGDWFAAGNSSEKVDAFLAGSNNKLPFADRISGHPVGGYVDLQKIIDMSSSLRMGRRDSSFSTGAKNMWQDIVFTGGDFKDDFVSSKAEINLVNKNVNSLKQLSQFIDQLAPSRQEINIHDSKIIADTLSVTPGIK